MEMKVTIDDNTAKIMAIVASETKTILKAIGTTAEGYAKQECPVNTGRLRNSITNQEEDNAVYVGSNVEYAADVEFMDRSHKNGKAHFLRDSLQNHLDEYKQMIKDGFESALD